MDIWTVMHTVHLLAMAFFVGGQIMLIAVLVPVLRGREEMKVVARRFGVGSLIALALMVFTGVQLTIHEDAWGDAVLLTKLALFAVLIVAMAYHVHAEGKRWLDPVIGSLSLAVMVLGVVLAH
jgi:putative copper export protein